MTITVSLKSIKNYPEGRILGKIREEHIRNLYIRNLTFMQIHLDIAYLVGYLVLFENVSELWIFCFDARRCSLTQYSIL